MPQSKWQKTKGYSKRGFDKAWNTLDKLGPPVNRLSNKLGAEAFWPTTLDKESDKAARILRSFCKDGFYTQIDNESEATNGTSPRTTSEDGGEGYKDTGENNKDTIDRPKGKQRVVKKIPSAVIKQAKGLAIFTAMRTGLWLSGAGGSGILVARVRETGKWSPPSGIMLHTTGLGFLAGADIYDCVVVINTYEALEAFKAVRCTLGGEVSAAAGPFGVGGVMDSEVHKRRAPVWTYVKSRGLYAGVQIDGTIVIERSDENERFYGERIGVADILAGKGRHAPSSIGTLMETIKAAQGDTDVDETMLPPPGEAPGDVDVETDIFGIPQPEDQDPFGVMALEKEGVLIREAGTKRIASADMFEFRPSPSSPLHNRFSRSSIESSPRASWRSSVQSTASADRGTQTDDLVYQQPPNTPPTTPPGTRRPFSESFKRVPSVNHHISYVGNSPRVESMPPTSNRGGSVVIQDQSLPGVLNQAHPTSPSFARARLITIPKRTPPPLPPRNALRISSISEPGPGVLERETGSTIGSYADAEILEVHGNNKNGKSTKHSSVAEVPSNQNDDSLNKYVSIQDTCEANAPKEEPNPAEEKESSDRDHMAGRDELQENGISEEVLNKNSANLLAEEEGAWEETFLREMERIENERTGEEVESAHEIVVAQSDAQPLQTEFSGEHKEEFHSISTSPTPPKLGKKTRNKKKCQAENEMNS
ncbi:DUF500 domain-containing protein [Histoplasma ohiense]|nr:DUF500 domain-containing protein [Histoplasma ohiense (nom. inval.)]